MKNVNKQRNYFSRLIRPGNYSTHQKSPFLVRMWTKKRILLYTDSRGINIPDHFYYKHFSTRLLHQYDVDAYLCPEKWTTVLDFLKLWKGLNGRGYDYVILHAGAVDAAPRHKKIFVGTIYADKKDIFNEVFGEKVILDHLKTDLDCGYEGDQTINMYSLDMAERFIIPRLRDIPNLIWIGSNKIDTSWRGNYWKDRPKNIKLIEDYSRVFAARLRSVIDLLELWSLDDVRRFTFDNIHPNKAGSDFIYDELLMKLKSN
jgi:hypothetical protein